MTCLLLSKFLYTVLLLLASGHIVGDNIVSRTVIRPKLVNGLTGNNDDDIFMSYIYSSYFQFQVEVSVVLNCIIFCYIKRNLSIVLVICF